MYEASASGGYSMAGGLGYLGGGQLTAGQLCGPSGGRGRARQCSRERRRWQRDDEFNERVDHRVDRVDYGRDRHRPGLQPQPGPRPQLRTAGQPTDAR